VGALNVFYNRLKGLEASPASPRAPSTETRPGTSTGLVATSSAPTRPPVCSTRNILFQRGRPRFRRQYRPVACAFAVGFGIPRVPAHLFEPSDAGSHRRVSAVRPELPALYLCVRQVDAALTELKSRYALCGSNDVADSLNNLRASLDGLSIERILEAGLHDFIDFVRRQLVAITLRLSTAFFGHRPAEDWERWNQRGWEISREGSGLVGQKADESGIP
jgi:hypothetical protein